MKTTSCHQNNNPEKIFDNNNGVYARVSNNELAVQFPNVVVLNICFNHLCYTYSKPLLIYKCFDFKMLFY